MPPPPLRLARLDAAVRLCCERALPIGSSRRPLISAISRPSSSHHPSLNASISPIPSLAFSTTVHRFKKAVPKAQKSHASANSAHIPDNKAQANRGGTIDPYDFSELDSKIKQQVDWLRDSLQKLRSGGRVSPETIEGLQVELKHGVKEKKTVERVRLGDLATVVPRGGRLMVVLVNEEEHLKPITTAIQSAPYSLAPTPDPASPTSQLHIPIPPPTAESRQQTLADAKKEYEKASTGVKDARAAWQKWYRKADKEKLVVRDELEKAHKKMEAVVEKGQKAVKEVWEGAVRGMER